MILTTSEAIAIYDVYPRKVGKPVAIRKIIGAISKHGFETVLKNTQAFAERYKAIGTPMDKIPHPSTFFFQERYMDELDAALPLPQSSPTTAKPLPLWQRLKATEALLETAKQNLKRTPIPDKFLYDWSKGTNRRYDHDLQKATANRESLKNICKTLQDTLNTIREQIAQGGA